MSNETSLIHRIQNTVDRGAASAQEIHQTIADLPFEVLERNDLFVEPATELREFQTRTLGAIYDAVRNVNQRVGELASDLLDPFIPTGADDGDDGDDA